MADAIEIFFGFWSSILNFLFTGMYILPNISVGYVLTVIIIAVVILNITVSLPKKGDKDE